jgi:hypothetical protein
MMTTRCCLISNDGTLGETPSISSPFLQGHNNVPIMRTFEFTPKANPTNNCKWRPAIDICRDGEYLAQVSGQDTFPTWTDAKKEAEYASLRAAIHFNATASDIGNFKAVL